MPKKIEQPKAPTRVIIEAKRARKICGNKSTFWMQEAVRKGILPQPIKMGDAPNASIGFWSDELYAALEKMRRVQYPPKYYE